jgi:predicted DNA-binding transcriptional regulator YafY
VERLVEPLGLVLKGGVWYVVAAVDDTPRTYRARRVLNAAPTGETFARPGGFDLPRYWSESIAAYERDAPRVTVTLRVDARAIGILMDVLGERAVREALDGADGPDTDGRRLLAVTADWPEEVPGRLVALGGAVEILDPPEVREKALELARRLIERHAPVS